MFTFRKSPLLGITVLSLLIASCVRPVHREIEKVRIGMDKGQVLELVGGPKHTQRNKGRDAWIYQYYRDHAPLKKTIYFRAGLVESIGKTSLRFTPSSSPQTADTAPTSNYSDYEKWVRERQQSWIEGFEDISTQ